MNDKIDEKYFERFEENLTDKQKYKLRGLLDYQLFRLSKANEEFIDSLKTTWFFRMVYKVLDKLV